MLISEEYRKQNAQLHAERPDYGRLGASKWADTVRKLADKYRATTILDYGCGKGLLRGALMIYGLDVRNYDPAIEEWAGTPEPAELVVCNDVLEHIEPDCLEAVLDDLKRVTARVGMFVVATDPAKKTLPDGRNAHLIQQTARWWLPKFCERWEIAHMQRAESDNAFMVVVQA